MPNTENALGNAKMHRLVDRFVTEYFTSQEIDEMLIPNSNDKLPFHSAAVIVYSAMASSRPSLIKQLVEFTPHPSVQFGVLRNIFTERYKAKTEGWTNRPQLTLV